MSEFTKKKAQYLIDANLIIQIDDNAYQVRASESGKSYILRNGACECKGYRWRGECSHVTAVQILQKQSMESDLTMVKQGILGKTQNT